MCVAHGDCSLEHRPCIYLCAYFALAKDIPQQELDTRTASVSAW